MKKYSVMFRDDLGVVHESSYDTDIKSKAILEARDLHRIMSDDKKEDGCHYVITENTEGKKFVIHRTK